MKNLWYSRRAYIATIAVLGLVYLGWSKGADVAMPIASIAIAVAGANAYEQGKTKPNG
jgi:hypothetical protein